MDSVTKDTSTTLKHGESMKTLQLRAVDEESWCKNDNVITQRGEEEFADCNGLKLWTNEG